MSERNGPTLYERINLVKRDVGRVEKNGKNLHFGYKFATESDIADAIRPLMAEHGVCLVYHGPDMERMKITECGSTSKGAVKYRYQVWVRYSVVNAQSPEERFETWGYGEALDTEDKGHNKAITNAHKYVHIKLFDVSTGDLAVDPDTSAYLSQQPNGNAPPPQRPVAAKSKDGDQKQMFKNSAKAWTKLKAEDVAAACLIIAQRNGHEAVAGLTEDQYAKLNAFCNEQIRLGTDWLEWSKA